MAKERPLTGMMRGALQWIASRGEMTVRRENRFIADEIAARTAHGLERRGLVERRWTGAEDGVVYITDAGRELADKLLTEGDDVEGMHEFETDAPEGTYPRKCKVCGRIRPSDLHYS